MSIFRSILFIVSILLSVLLSAPGISFAQTDNVCRAIVTQGLAQSSVNCATNEPGTACYATEVIESELSTNVNSESFDEPGESVSLSDVISVQPSPVDLTDQSWGIALLNVQANLFTGADDDVVILAFGGTEIENGTPSGSGFVPLEAPMNVTTTEASDVYEVTLGQPVDAKIIGQAQSGASFLADAVSEDAEWIRIRFNNVAGWITANVITEDISELPIYGPNHMSEMQSFYFHTGDGDNACLEAPSSILVQGPRDTVVDVILNGVTVRIEGSIVIRTLPPGSPVGPQMQIIVLSGLATINPDTEDEIITPPGFSMIVELGPDFVSSGNGGDDDERGPAPISFSPPILLTQDQLDEFDFLDNLPGNILNYPVIPPQLVNASGVGQPAPQLIFEDDRALTIVQELCAEDRLSEDDCQIYGF